MAGAADRSGEPAERGKSKEGRAVGAGRSGVCVWRRRRGPATSAPCWRGRAEMPWADQRRGTGGGRGRSLGARSPGAAEGRGPLMQSCSDGRGVRGPGFDVTMRVTAPVKGQTTGRQTTGRQTTGRGREAAGGPEDWFLPQAMEASAGTAARPFFFFFFPRVRALGIGGHVCICSSGRTALAFARHAGIASRRRPSGC